MLGAKIVAEARTWIGTPWHHQGCVKGVGVDCIGLVKNVFETVTGLCVDVETNYHRMPPVGRESRILEGLSKYATEVDKSKLQPGDVLLFHFLSGLSNHVGIFSGDGQFIHAWLDVGKVVEMPLAGAWERAIKTAFRVPEEQ